MIEVNLQLEEEELEALWSLMYNLSTNNLYLDRKTNEIKIRPLSEEETVIDPLSFEELLLTDKLQSVLWKVRFPNGPD